MLHLDPRCKLYLLLLGNLLLYLHVSLGTEILLMAAFLVPFYLSSKRMLGLRLTVMYLVLVAADLWLVPVADGIALQWIALLAEGVRMMFPCLVTGAYAFSTTTVSEFVCALRKAHVPESVVIPCMVVIRFFPTIREDYRQIRAAMAIRGIGGSTLDVLAHPMQSLEYVVIPLLMNSSNVAQDLTVAALTKGIGMTGEHSSLTEIRFCLIDAAYMLLCTTLLVGGKLYL